ncbi:calcium-binding protein [Marimonas lutisalis]|uniref:calcium-binding protein n=1 Tax=Marimonas lutisalis TaxID=2545756 RepID=UPI0010F4BE4E|nr:calcium-binding protein [Marimonas lutisalis]
MVELGTVRVFAQAQALPFTGVSDLDLRLFGTQWVLLATERVLGSVSTFTVLDSGAPAGPFDFQAIAGGSLPPDAIELIDTGAGPVAFSMGASRENLASYTIEPDGGIGQQVFFVPASGLTTAMTEAAAVTLESGATLLITAQYGQQGFTVQRLDNWPLASHVQTVTLDGAAGAFETVMVGGTPVVLVADVAEGAVRSYVMEASGALSAVDVAGPEQGLGLARPDILRSVELGGVQYVLVAAPGSSSISVVELQADGALVARDHVLDGRNTRFEQITEMAVVTAGERVFVLAAGRDDGLSLLELLPNGRLLHHLSMADRLDLPLDNIGGLAAAVQGNTLHVFAGSEAEEGLAELQLDLGQTGEMRQGGTDNATVQGTAGDDVLWGGPGGANTLIGGVGDDIVIAGGIEDRLRGDDGADRFVVGWAQSSRVDDFNVAEDWLDLSGWFMLYDLGQLAFNPNGRRLEIVFGTQSVVLVSHDGSDLDVAEVGARIRIDLGHVMVSKPPVDPQATYMHYGTPGDDRLAGDIGLDIFVASRGADIYDGDENRDAISFEEFSEAVKLNLLDPSRNEGEVQDDTLISIESIIGTAFGDVLSGDHQANWFWGGVGGDVMLGRSDRDKLFGGDGDDRFNGGKGRDRIEGQDGDDRLEGRRGHDNLRGGKGNDMLDGGTKNDIMIGGRGRDTLIGGEGDDRLSGDAGADLFVFADGHGHDVLQDFEPDIPGERIDLSGVTGIGEFADVIATASQEGAHLRIVTGPGSSILLEWLALDDLAPTDFVF